MLADGENEGKETLFSYQTTSAIRIKIRVASGLTNGDQSAIAIDRLFVTKRQKVENHR
jgi:hypothetical protein